ASSTPISEPLSNVPADAHTYTTKSTYNRGGVTTSTAVTVNVDVSPTVSITAPAHNAIYTAPVNIVVTAQAADSDGSIARVEFYNGSTLITTVTSAPYSFIWSGVPQGSYSLTAKAFDNNGFPTTSAPVNVTVNQAAATTLYFIQVDHLDTPRAIYDDQQRLEWK